MLAYSYNITTTDPDSGASLSITAPTLPAWLSLSDNGDGTATLSGTPGDAAVGANNVVLAVFDGALTTTQNFTINVANVNDVPVIDSDGGGATAALNAAENQTGVTTVTATDVDAGDTPTFSLSGGSDAALFSIDPGTGVLSFNTAPDFETATDADADGVYEVEVRVDDGHGGTDTQAISVTVTDVNEAPSFTSAAPTAATEDAGLQLQHHRHRPGQRGEPEHHGPDPAGLAEPERQRRRHGDPVGHPGQRRGGRAYTWCWRSSTAALTTTQNFTINVANVNDVPVIDSDGGGATAALNAAENQTGVTTVTATDVDAGDTPTFSLSGGSDAALFSIDPNTGVLSFNTAPDFETATDADADGVYEVEVRVDDGHGGTDTQAISVTVTDVNDAPVANDDPGAFSADVLSLNPVSYWRLGETSGTSVTDIGSVGNATGTYNGPSLGESDPINGDPDSAAGFNRTELDYIEIAHVDAYLLDEGTVQLWFNADDLAQDQTLFSKDSSGLDNGGHLTIRVLSDGRIETRLQSTSGDNFVYSGAGSVTAGNWHHIAFTFGYGGMQLYLDGSRVDTNPYAGGFGTTSGGAGNKEPIAIGAGTRTSGNGTVTPLNDYFDGRIDEVAIFGTALSGADINRLNGGALQHYTLAEDTSLSVAAAEGVLANDFDEEGDPLTAILVSAPTKAASFTLNVDGSFNYTPIADFSGTDSFTYRADDGTAGSNVATVTINVANVNDVPVIDSDGGGATAAVSAAENQTGVTTVTATDVDAGDTPTFSLSGGSDAALFSIDPNTGVLSFNTAPDFETATDADARRRLRGRGHGRRRPRRHRHPGDLGHRHGRERGAELHQRGADRRHRGCGLQLQHHHHRPGQRGGLTITAPTLPAWLSLSDNGDGTATLSGTPGNAAVGANNVVLAVFDGALTTTQSFTINVANVNDVPVIDSDGGGATAAVSAAENQTGVTTVTATDVDAGDTPTFSLSGGSDAALFSIDPNTGVLSFNTAPDFETATDADADGVYEVEVRVDDGHGGTDTQAISVTVTDVNEAPSFTSAAPTAATEDAGLQLQHHHHRPGQRGEPEHHGPDPAGLAEPERQRRRHGDPVGHPGRRRGGCEQRGAGGLRRRAHDDPELYDQRGQRQRCAGDRLRRRGGDGGAERGGEPDRGDHRHGHGRGCGRHAHLQPVRRQRCGAVQHRPQHRRAELQHGPGFRDRDRRRRRRRLRGRGQGRRRPRRHRHPGDLGHRHGCERGAELHQRGADRRHRGAGLQLQHHRHRPGQRGEPEHHGPDPAGLAEPERQRRRHGDPVGHPGQRRGGRAYRGAGGLRRLRSRRPRTLRSTWPTSTTTRSSRLRRLSAFPRTRHS